ARRRPRRRGGRRHGRRARAGRSRRARRPVLVRRRLRAGLGRGPRPGRYGRQPRRPPASRRGRPRDLAGCGPMTPAPLAGGAPGLHLEEIRIAFADGPERLVALDGATLSVAPGELVAVAGRSGSGKSTLLAVAGLLRRPDSGEVTVDG